ncbi:MAG: CaiB/BaiF CoA transferase family protein [bacterium]
MSSSHSPLSGYRVLDLTNVLSGPFCCQQLAAMGAEVIKIELPGSGDLARQLGADTALSRAGNGVSFLAQNAGKQSVTINLKKIKGKDLLRKMVAQSDVLVENFRPGVMDKLGLGYDILKQTNPDLIYCAISGFGQTGPLKDLPAYDQIIQGMSGVMSITGNDMSAPLRVGYPVADTVGGLTAAFAVSAALARKGGERGCMIDVSMLESTLTTMGWVISNYLTAQQHPKPMGNDNFTASPSGTFETGKGLLNIAANKQDQFVALCEVLGRKDLIEDPRFCDRHMRLKYRAELKSLIEQSLVEKDAEQWQDILVAAGVPAGCVLTVPEILAHQQIRERDLILSFESTGKTLHSVKPGFLVDGTRPSTDTPPPELSQHTNSVLSALGLSGAEIRQLHKEDVI